MERTDRKLLCVSSGNEFPDDGIRNEEPGAASLLRAVYGKTGFAPNKDAPGLYRYADWLPIDKTLEGSAAPVSFWSKELGKKLGLPRLLITFSGYRPEKGAFMKTGSFKECEAYSVCARFPPGKGSLVVASAGNTARAFIRAASENRIPLVIVIPEKNLNSLYTVSPKAGCVRVVAAGGGCDYYDAIMLANKICERPGFISEGGAKNVARRDGMGTTVLSAAEFTSGIPDWYVQAIGSGTGAIAAHEANLRLNASGFCSAKNMRLLLTQNIPFTPITDAWNQKTRTIGPIDAEKAKLQIDEIDAKVLSNRAPPYGIAGGLYDVLEASNGILNAVTNDEIRTAQALFEECEGIDIGPESGAALASLIKALKDGLVSKDDSVMLNITGGGDRRIQRDFNPQPVFADFIVPPESMEQKDYLDDLCVKLNLKT